MVQRLDPSPHQGPERLIVVVTGWVNDTDLAWTQPRHKLAGCATPSCPAPNYHQSELVLGSQAPALMSQMSQGNR